MALRSIDDFLPKAITPERKNKKNIKKTSFVITSSANKKDLEEKKQIKEEIEKRKEENRKKRQDKKTEKETKKEETVQPDPQKNIIQKSGLCFTCVSNMTSKKIGIRCQNCTRAYHFACLLKNGVFKDFFLCSVCFIKKK